MIEINDCSVYANRELVKSPPNDAVFVPTERIAVGGRYIKICPNSDYYRVVHFNRVHGTTSYEARAINGQDINGLLNDPINFLMYDDIKGTIRLSGGKIMKAFIPDDTFYVETGENEARIRIQTVEPGLYYATIYNVRTKFINYEGFMIDENGRNADEAVRDPKNFRFAWDYIVLNGGYWLVKKILSPEELERLKEEGKVAR